MAMKTNGGVMQIGGVVGLREGRSAGTRAGDRGAARRSSALPADAAAAAAAAAAPRAAARGHVSGRRRGAGARRGPRRPRWRDRRPRDARRRIGARSSSGGWREIDRQVAGRRPRDREGLRRSHRLRGEADRHRPRRHLVGLRRRRRHRRLEQRRRDVQRDAGARAPRLHRGADRARSGAAICCACGARSRRSRSRFPSNAYCGLGLRIAD